MKDINEDKEVLIRQAIHDANSRLIYRIKENIRNGHDIMMQEQFLDSYLLATEIQVDKYINIELKGEPYTGDIFTPEFIDEIGFIWQDKYRYQPFGQEEYVTREVTPPYGRAIDKKMMGMTVLQWNTEGHSVDYFGKPLPPNVSFAILKDGGTRFAFNGYVFSQEDVRRLINLTQ